MLTRTLLPLSLVLFIGSALWQGLKLDANYVPDISDSPTLLVVGEALRRGLGTADLTNWFEGSTNQESALSSNATSRETEFQLRQAISSLKDELVPALNKHEARVSALLDEIAELKAELKRRDRLPDKAKLVQPREALKRQEEKQEPMPLTADDNDSQKALATSFGVREETSIKSHLRIAGDLKKRREKYGFNATMCEAPAGRRRKVHWCHHQHHMDRPMKILQNEFCMDHMVNAYQTNDWDIIFGGYPHCGEGRHTEDWNMETGLNKHLNEMGWENLQWHQVWFPCMGCSESYCNKRDLCPLLKTIDPSLCYELPGDLPLLQQDMEQQAAEDSTKVWVLKRDSISLNLYHGAGVSFIEEPSQLPSASEMEEGTYLVQKFIDQWMGQGQFYRRHEIRVYVAVTSTSPLRVYAFGELWGNFANKQFDPEADLSKELCMLDTHVKEKKCAEEMDIPEGERAALTFEKIAELIELPPWLQEKFLLSAKTMLAKVILASQPTVNTSPVNQGITKSGASCFSFLRADMAITRDGTAALYEINEFPFANEKLRAGRDIQRKAYRDLFRMIGMDVAPMKADQRKEYELKHLGGWKPLIIDGKHATSDMFGN